MAFHDSRDAVSWAVSTQQVGMLKLLIPAGTQGRLSLPVLSVPLPSSSMSSSKRDKLLHRPFLPLAVDQLMQKTTTQPSRGCINHTGNVTEACNACSQALLTADWPPALDQHANCCIKLGIGQEGETHLCPGTQHLHAC